MIIPIILSGGCGSRLWPVSRKQSPKQILNLKNQHSLLQNTILRIAKINDVNHFVIICNEEQRFLVKEQLHTIGIKNFTLILEPEGRNTAPAIALATCYCQMHYQNPVLLITPSDHCIAAEEPLFNAITLGEQLAQNHKLITFGMKPKSAHTGFGYIKFETTQAYQGAYPIKQFTEKPDLKTAQQFLLTNDYLWNSGIFMAQTSLLINEYNQYANHMLQHCKTAIAQAIIDSCFVRPESEPFLQCESIAFDYAIMEKTTKGVVIPTDCQWNDLGTWSQVWEVSEKDNNNNAIMGDVLLHDVAESYISANSRLVAAIGIKDQIIVETADAILIADKKHSNEVKMIVSQLEFQQRIETQSHRKVYRPWGSFEILGEDSNFKVKKLVINPGAHISLQIHQHRSEHWVVINGKANIIKANENFILTKNMSIYIPPKTKHRISNVENTVLELIEVQVGSYLGEDDIIRFEDSYGRACEPMDYIN